MKFLKKLIERFGGATTAVWRGRIVASVHAFPRLFEMRVSGSDRLALFWHTANARLQATFASGGASPGNIIGGSLGTDCTIAITWRADGSYAIASTLGGVVTGTNAQMVGTLSDVCIGCNGSQANSQHKVFACKPAPVTDSELEALVARVAA